MGTLVHEYVHYLQNITTIFGLRNSLFYFNYLFEIKKHIIDNNNFEIPLRKIQFSNGILRGKSLFQLYHGSSKVFSPEFDNVIVYTSKNGLDGIDVINVCIDLYAKDKKLDTVVFGNNCVKESMAYLYQQLFDKNVKPPIFPYLSVEVLCNSIYPEILTDKRKLIAICLISLNSQNSGLTFYQLLLKSKSEKELNGIELYKKYSFELTVINGEKEYSIKEYLVDSMVKFKEALSCSLITKLKYFDLLLDNIKLSAEENILPLIEVLYEDKKSSIEKLESLINFYGIPHIRTLNGYNLFPQNTELEEPTMEFVELIGQRIVFDRILGLGINKDDTMCSLYLQCELSEDDIVDEHCFDKQWERDKLCPFKIISDNWKLYEKTITDNTLKI